MGIERTTNRKWTWGVALFLMLSLTGCGMYPSKPGAWPGGPWGSLLRFVSGVIDFFPQHMGVSYGVSLLIVTILVRLLIFPLVVKQLRYSKVMQTLQPEMTKVREKHKGDNTKIQQEMMKLYQERGINPMAGCLPTLLQLPILYALYGAIEGNVLLNKSVFLGLFPLGHPDPRYILPVLAAITTYFSSKVSMAGVDSKQTRMMLFIMPVFVLFIGSRFPSGLALYWIYGNVFTAIQSYFIRVRPNQKAEQDKGKDNGPKGNAKKLSAKEGNENKPSKRGSSK